MPILARSPAGFTLALFGVGSLFTGACGPTRSPAQVTEPLACASDDDCDSARVCDLMTHSCRGPTASRDIDVLFVIDNSPSMTTKQKALAANIPKFISRIDASGADYHVAIATSDIGTTGKPGMPWGGNLGTCDTYQGDDGVLQAIPCTARTGSLTEEARAACDTLCPDPHFAPIDGKNFIWKQGGRTNVPPDWQPDGMGKRVDLGPQRAFQCLALVGDGGCGIEGQIEGAKRALDNHRPENAGFLRHGSMLAVIFITDEDDCSVQLSRRAENSPDGMDCPTPDSAADWTCYNPDYRCFARSVACDEPMNTAGDKHRCHERVGNYLEPISNYASFFAALRPAPRLLVGGIWTIESAERGGPVNIVSTNGWKSSWGLNRAIGSNDGCVYAGDKTVFGRPQVRLSKLARNFSDSIEISVCDIDDYPRALDSLARAIVIKSGPVG